jgi:hypothetical protein
MTSRGARYARPLLVLAAIGLALVVAAARGGHAATPGSGTISSSSPTVSWNGPPMMAPTASSACAGPSDPSCDSFKLTIEPLATPYQVVVELQPFAAGDWDLAVFGPDGGLAGHSGNAPGQLEVVTLTNPPAGTYTVSGAPFAPNPGPASYTAQATIKALGGGTTPSNQGAEHVTFANYAAPTPLGQDAGEPSIGANWKSGNVMYQSGLQALRVGFDDCSSPGTPTWTDVSWLPTSVASLDPIGYCDAQTGRWFTSQLSGTTSLAAYTDDDGATWTQSEGGPLNGGVDHQTFGGGPFAAPLSGTVYPNAVYYCSQDLIAALCARSDTGGLTFAPAVPIYTSECGGLHGHVKVAYDGTVYVPNKSCANRQSVAVSTDNGVTWTVRPGVPGSTSGAWDPSVGLATDGTVYFAYDDGDGHMKVAVSHDKGASWVNVRDVGAPLGVVQSAFPVADAGDPDRAAVAFLGTTYAGSGAFGDDPTWPGVWHLYIATTYDGGNTWTTVDATPNDPVQKGTICGGGFNGCDNGTRNLLDFMGSTVDNQGRFLVGYPDGCIGECITGGPGSFSAVASIARQVSGKRLYARFDPTGAPSAPAVSAKPAGTANVVDWQEPDDHGSAITAYMVYRRASGSTTGTLLATLGATARSYSDAAPPAGSTYAVTAVNASGESAVCRYVAPTAGADVPKGTPCQEPGVTILTDASGDSTGGDPAKDVLSLSIAEPKELGAGKLEFVLRVASLESVPSNSTWPVQFKAADGSDRWVRMKTDAAGALSFAYGTGTSVTAAGAAADPASTYLKDGTIKIVVPRDAVGAVVGQKLTAFLVRIRTELALGSALTPDNMPDSLARTGEYTVFGSENCTTPTPDLTLGASDIGWVTEKVTGGDRVTFVATVHNTGTAAASNVKVRFLVDGAEIKTVTIPQIAAGAFSRASAAWDAKGRTGDHTVTVTADPANAIAEVAEDNNSASKTFTVKGNKVQ